MVKSIQIIEQTKVGSWNEVIDKIKKNLGRILMYLDSMEKLNTMTNHKKDNNYLDYDINQLVKLPTFSGIWELKFRGIYFKMINIYNDDLVPTKFLEDKYEQLSLNLWYEFSRILMQFI